MRANIPSPASICHFCAFVGSLVISSASQAAELNSGVQTVRYRVTGLFQPDRVDDLREELKQWPEVTLVSVDYKLAEGEFKFDPAIAFPHAKPAQWTEQFNNRLRGLTQGTFGVRGLLTIPRETLEVVEIPILGLDCKGCSFAAYDAVCRLPGVEQATASFKHGLVTAWINPDETDREKLEAALKQRRVTLKEKSP